MDNSVLSSRLVWHEWSAHIPRVLTAIRLVKGLAVGVVVILAIGLGCCLVAPLTAVADAGVQRVATDAHVSSVSPRIVSLNLCIDRLLLQILPLERITGLSDLSLRPDYSGFSGPIPLNKIHHGQVEELVYMRPDLILAGQYGAAQTVATLRQLGVPVEVLLLPRTLPESREFVLRVGKLVGADAAAQAFWGKQEQLLREASRRVAASNKRRTLLYAPNGMAIGSGTLEDIILTHIGLINVAGDLGVSGWQGVSLENLLMVNIDRILLTGTSTHFSLAQEVLSHPVLRNRLATKTMAEGLSVCPALHAGELAMSMAP